MEDTQVMENDKLIEEMLLNAKEAPEPGDEDGRIVHRGDEDQPAPMTISTLTSAGWVYIYDTKDGERSIANRNNLNMLLKIKYPNGNRRFTTQPLPYSPKVGTLKCLLHKDNPEREHYDELGLPVCRKANLKNKFTVTQHMHKRHPMEWKAIEQERLDREKEEEREFRLALMQKNQPAPIPASETEELIVNPCQCEICGKVCKSNAGLVSHMRINHKE